MKDFHGGHGGRPYVLNCQIIDAVIVGAAMLLRFAQRVIPAWLGLTPWQHSSGGKEKLGRITKMGDKYLRTLRVVGMTSLINA